MSQLSSEILEEQFGATKLSVLAQDQVNRIISTSRVADRKLLELSWVSFDQVNEYPQIHQDILTGTSMGIAFKKHGIAFDRQVLRSCRLDLPSAMSNLFASKTPATVLEISAVVGEARTAYARVLEVYVSEVSWPEMVADDKTLSKDINEFNRLLISRGIVTKT